MTTAPAAYTLPANGWRTFLIVWVTQSISVFGSALLPVEDKHYLDSLADRQGGNKSVTQAGLE